MIPQNEEVVVSVNKVSKDFKLPHQKHSSIKSLFTNMLSMGNKTFETQQALKNISFEVKKGEFFGIVGRNGSGKSTLLKILAGIYQPTNGSVAIKGRLVPFIELGVGFNPELTGRENVYMNGALLGFSEIEIEMKYKAIVNFAELERFMDQKLKNYSSGMQVRLAFSVATILAESDVLLIDEVLAVGDADFQRKCFEYFRKLKKLNKTVIFVTHDMSAVKEYCDRALLIQDSEVLKEGKPSEVAAEYQKLFLGDDGTDTAEPDINTKKRWGNHAAKYINIKAGLKGEDLIVTATIEPNRDLESIFFGVHVFSGDGVEVTATNNRMINQPDIKNVVKGKPIKLEWKILNIFNDGRYTVTLTMVDDAIGIIDWVEDAASFKVRRPERSTTNVMPPTSIKIERE
jgi:ABC-2 type transport system ATP-binding protein